MDPDFFVSAKYFKRISPKIAINITSITLRSRGISIIAMSAKGLKLGQGIWPIGL